MVSRQPNRVERDRCADDRHDPAVVADLDHCIHA
jgi:hypothetical protein